MTCEHVDTFFDRSLCACGAMHNYCEDCGAQVDECLPDFAALRAKYGGAKYGGPLTPLEKAAVIDKHARSVKAAMLSRLTADTLWDEVLAVARARHILGHYEYGDTNLFEWSDGKVRAAIIEELADAVVYQAWLEERACS